MAKRFTFYDETKSTIQHNITPYCLIKVFKKSDSIVYEEDLSFEIIVKNELYVCVIDNSSLNGNEDVHSLSLAVKKAAKWYKAMILSEQKSTNNQ